jgi:cbb3-type cytochrome oxidase maturation protein
MEILYLLVPISLGISLIFVILFIFTVKSGQYDDLVTPSVKMLLDDIEETKTKK